MISIWPSIVAEFKQRTRQQSYIVTLLAMSALTFLFFPSPDAEYQTLVLNGYRGIYNSAWIGICLAMLNVLLLPIICFYLVKNAIALDMHSKTCELIAATPIRKQTYLFAKWTVNVFILFSIVAVMLLSSLVIQLYYGESYQIDPWALLWPHLVFVMPVLFAIASVALMFESIKWLQGGLGNVAYFFLWVGSIAQSIEGATGIGSVMEAMEADVSKRFPESTGNSNLGVTINDDPAEVKTYVWEGIQPTLAHITDTLPLFGVSLLALLIAFVCFDRFAKVTESSNERSNWLAQRWIKQSTQAIDHVCSSIMQRFYLSHLIYMELKLLLKNRSGYWYLGLIILNVIQFVIDKPLLTSVVLPISWLWCVLVISQLGQFEKQAGTLELMTYSLKSPLPQSLAAYIAGWLLVAMACLGSMIRFSMMGEDTMMIQLLIAISFTVSLAYFCGAMTGNKRMFEALYPAIWYIGPLQAALYVDFFGVNSEQSWQAGVPYIYALMSFALLGLTLWKRKARYV